MESSQPLWLKMMTMQQTNYRNMTEKKVKASAKSKAQADQQLHHICFCPNRTADRI
jgi:hypothetical protein